jgi:hypothetical protein
MIEASTDRATRNAIQNAHKERAKAMKDVWAWMFGGKKYC